MALELSSSPMRSALLCEDRVPVERACRSRRTQLVRAAFANCPEHYSQSSMFSNKRLRYTSVKQCRLPPRARAASERGRV